jgi:hypothetical protein
MFSITLSLLKKIDEFLHMMGAISSFEKNYLIFNIVDYRLLTKSLGPGCTFEEVTEKKIVKR